MLAGFGHLGTLSFLISNRLTGFIFISPLLVVRNPEPGEDFACFSVIVGSDGPFW
jgi:hypothetical protein